MPVKPENLGTITEFPIEIIFEFASEFNSGICPALCAYIHDDRSMCDHNTPVSEHGIRLLQDNVNELSGIIHNIGSGTSIMEYEEEASHIFMHNRLVRVPGTIIGNDTENSHTTLHITLDNGTITLDGKKADDEFPPDPSYIIAMRQNKSVQGGLYQNVSYVDYNDINSAGANGVTLMSPPADTVIGKMFIKAIEKFEQDETAKFSVGMPNNTTGYISEFEPPYYYDGFLIRNDWFEYGDKLAETELDWIYPNENQPIKLFYNGGALTKGKFKINIFYDNVIWRPNYGYIYTGYGEKAFSETDNPNDSHSPINVLLRYDITNNTISERREAFICPTRWMSVQSHSSWIYIAGGTNTDITGASEKIYKADSKNDMVSEIEYSVFPIPVMGNITNRYNQYLIFTGGFNEANPDGISDIYALNDSVGTVHLKTATLTTARYAHTSTSDIHNGTGIIYNIGGDSASGPLNNIEIYDYPSDSISAGPTLSYSAKYAKSFVGNNGFNIINGFNGTSTVSFNNYFDFATMTKTVKSEAPVKITGGSSFHTSEIMGYMVSGREDDLGGVNWTNLIQIYALAADTWSISDTTARMSGIGDATTV